MKELHIPNVLVSAVRLPLVVLLLCSTGSSVATAQDAHYWTYQYGSRANMLGGAVVGSIRDPSAAYYNPGAIGFGADTTLVVSADVLQYRKLSYDGWGIFNEDMSTQYFGTAPSMFSLRLPLVIAENQVLAFSYLRRSELKMEFHGVLVEQLDYLPAAGVENISSEANFLQDMSDDWVGLTWSYLLSDRLAIGATTNVAVRSNRNRIQAFAQILTDDGMYDLVNVVNDYNFTNFRMLWKIGAAMHREPWYLGLTLTTPSVDLFGWGSANYNIGLFSSETPENNTLQAQHYEDLDADYKSPMSVAAGISYLFERTGLHLTVEWFDRVDEFRVMSLEGFAIDIGDQEIYPTLVHSLDDVFNIGIGINRWISEGVAIYGALTTDFSAYKSREESMLSFTNWDIYHATVGSSFTFYHIDFTLGLCYSFGEGSFEVATDLAGASSSSDLIWQTEDLAATYRQLRLIIGLDY